MYFRIPFFIISLFITISLSAQIDIKIEKIADGFTIPVDIAHMGDERLFVMGKRGVIMVFDRKDPDNIKVFLDITPKVSSSSNEKGLLGMAFHPDYRNNGFFYINYSDQSRNSVVARYSVANDPNTADPGSEKILMTLPQPFGNHNGGCLKFGPDGYLYIGWGDGGAANDPGNRSQNGQELLGKMLRIDVNTDQGYLIPNDNPFLDSAEVKNEIWAIGLRNPWRYSFDRGTGDLWIGDVGQNKWEEVDYQPSSSRGGENYGWRCYEAEQEFNTQNCKMESNYTFPIHFYRNQRGVDGCSVTGGFVYRGQEIPSLYGYYIYADFCSGKIWALLRDSSGLVSNEEIFKFGGNQISSFGEDMDGELYFTALQQGAIYKIRSNCDIDISIETVHEDCTNAQNGSAKIVFNQPRPDSLIIEWSNAEKGDSIVQLAPGFYSIKLISESCEFMDSFEILPFISVDPCLDVNGIEIELCKIDTYLLRSCVAPAGFNYHWIKDGNEINVPSNKFKNIKITTSGSYQVQWKIDNCDLDLSSPFKVTFLEVPDSTILSMSNDTLWANAGFELYEWYINDTLLTTTIVNFILIQESGPYKVKVGQRAFCLSDFSAVFYAVKTNIKTLNDDFIQLLIYPNPVSKMATISVNKSVPDAQVSIFDQQGRFIYVENYKTFDQLEIDVSNWNAGLYFIKIKTINKLIYEKMVVFD